MNIDEIAALLEAIPVPVACLGGNGHLEAANSPFLSLFPGAVVGRPYGLILRQPEILAAVEAAESTGKPRTVETSMTQGFRDQLWQVSAAPFGDDEAARVILTFEDRSADEESAQIRRDFVANVSHELRSPLTSLLGFVETLRTSARDDAAARDRFLSIMECEAIRMKRLVQDLLSLSQVEAEERLRPTQQADLSAVVGRVVDLVRPSAQAAGVTIDLVGLDDPRPIAGDPDQLGQVFANLVENALRYGGGGGRIEIRVEGPFADAGLRGAALRVDVIDFGDGFDPRHIPRLTERFYRIDSHRSRAVGGTGLGLAIVKHIVSRHRGRLKIESTPGEGSRFSVCLPV